MTQALAWQKVTGAVHAAGGKMAAQLMHAGALSQANRFRDQTVGPSAVQPKGKQMAFYRGDGVYPVPRAMSEAEIAEAIDGFARAAKLAVEVAGFDGIEIHGANGYLLDQFFTDYANRREDAWGGAIGQRLRLSLEVARAVRAAVGDAVPVGMRISQGKVNDYTHKWAEGADGAATVFGLLAGAGLDYIHVTEFEAWRPAFGDTGPSLVSLARRHAPELTIIANGGLHDPLRAAQVLGDGADLIALGRGALANPAWPLRVGRASRRASSTPACLRRWATSSPGSWRTKAKPRTTVSGTAGKPRRPRRISRPAATACRPPYAAPRPAPAARRCACPPMTTAGRSCRTGW